MSIPIVDMANWIGSGYFTASQIEIQNVANKLVNWAELSKIYTSTYLWHGIVK